MLSQVAILAGGFGTRLNAQNGGVPKPLTALNGTTILEHQILECKKYGFKNICILIHYKAEAIKSFIGDGAKYDVNISYRIEGEARGTAGAIWEANEGFEPNFLLLYSDIYFDIDLRRFYEKSLSKRSAMSIFVHPNDHPYDSDLVVLDSADYIKEIRPSPRDSSEIYKNLVSSGLAVINKVIFNRYKKAVGKYDLMSDVVPAMLKRGNKIYGYVSPEYAKDMGTPSRLTQVKKDIRSGLPRKFSRLEKRQAVFIDRDGTLNMDIPFLSDIDQFELIAGAADAIKILNKCGYLTLCVTNQPVVARGDLQYSQLLEIHKKLDKLLGDEGAYLDGIYVCPHHPDRGFEGEVMELKIKCRCRKPGVALIKKAINEFNINPQKSWVIGDRTSDILAGKKCGIKTILVLTGSAGLDKKCSVIPEYIFPDVLTASKWIRSGHENMAKKLKPLVDGKLLKKVALIGGCARSGKSTCAQVLKELVELGGRRTHIISADCWLKPLSQRQEGVGVLNRYDTHRFIEDMLRLVQSKSSIKINLASYEKIEKNFIGSNYIEINPDDFLIIEGIPALASERLNAEANIRIWVETKETERIKRVRNTLIMRGLGEKDIKKIIEDRNIDEVPHIVRFKNMSTYTLKN